MIKRTQVQIQLGYELACKLWAHLRGFEPTTKRIQAQFQLGYDLGPGQDPRSSRARTP
jgi:hypothetical protein